MESSSHPHLNYVGLLQEKCVKNGLNFPEYSGESVKLPGECFTYICKLTEWTTEGCGFNKREAKQNAAKAMYEKLENENLINDDVTKNHGYKVSAISKMNCYCAKEKKDIPLFSEMPEEDGLFVFSCTFEGFSSIGKGSSKKIAKEISADKVAKHFKVHKYYDDMVKGKDRHNQIKNPIQILHEFCSKKRLSCSFKEEQTSSKIKTYVVTCAIGDLEVKSLPNNSKKSAKMEAANLIVSVLNGSTPGASPVVESHVNTDLVECSEEESHVNTDLAEYSEEESHVNTDLAEYSEEENDVDISLPEYSGGESSEDEPLLKKSRT